MITKPYSELLHLWQSDHTISHLLGENLTLRNLTSNLPAKGNYEKLPVNATYAINDNPEISIIHAIEAESFSRAIVLMCSSGEKDKNEYLLWARFLAENTGKPVVFMTTDSNQINEAKYEVQRFMRFMQLLSNEAFINSCGMFSDDIVFDFFVSGIGIPVVRYYCESGITAAFTSSKVVFLHDNSRDDIAVHNLIPSELLPYSASSKLPVRPYYFSLQMNSGNSVPEFMSRRNPIIPSATRINLYAGYSVTENDFFPKESPEVTNNLFSKVFTMASWYLCGIN